MRKPICVVVPVYNHWNYMNGFWAGMESQTLDSDLWSVIVVDNGSNDLPQIEALPDFARLLSCSTPGSYAARNLALQNASEGVELFIFTDADCLPHENWLKEHWKAYRERGKSFLNAGAVTVTKLTEAAPNDYEIYDILCGIPQEHYVTNRQYAVTANLAVPADIFKYVGLFDAGRFSGGDADFCKRALAHGFELLYTPQAEVLHPARSTWSELSTKVRRVKGGQLKNGPLSRRIFYFLLTFIQPLTMMIRLAKVKATKSNKLKAMRVCLFLGLVQALESFRILFGGKAERR